MVGKRRNMGIFAMDRKLAVLQANRIYMAKPNLSKLMTEDTARIIFYIPI